MTQIVAHRGSSGNRPENTLPAFAEAVRVGADMIELDVHLSKDDQLIVMHDEEVDRTTDGKGLIREKTLAELKTLNAGSWFSSDYEATKIPTLKEVLDLLTARNYRGILSIEIKTNHYPYPGIEEQLFQLMTSEARPFRYWYCSFNSTSLAIIHELEPQIPLDLIARDDEKGPKRVSDCPYIEGIHPNYQWFAAHEAELRDFPKAIRPWTVNDDQSIEKCLRLGLSGVITDFPEKAILLKEQLQKDGNL